MTSLNSSTPPSGGNNLTMNNTNNTNSNQTNNSNQVVTTSTTTANTTQQQQQQQQQASNQQQFYRLKVEDALSYLDQVKFQFERQPEVYNQFLDIMKEFKSQAIDTPGVISRVSNLFRGHNDLIEGFNTFLPSGYKIEVADNNLVHYTAPNSSLSTLVQPISLPKSTSSSSPSIISVNNSNNTSVLKNEQANFISNKNIPSTQQPSQLSLKILTPQLLNSNPSIAAMTATRVGSTPTPPPIQTAATTTTAAAATAIQLTAVPSLPPPPPQSQPQNQVEFGHAINYVNKIKSRFHNQPDIYKSFLEILHTYQKQQKNIKEGIPLPNNQNFLSESEVFAKVAKLFKNQEDLLIEFSQFLPDANAAANNSNINMVSNTANLINHSNQAVFNFSQQQTQHQQQPMLQLQQNDFTGPYVTINGQQMPTIMSVPIQTLQAAAATAQPLNLQPSQLIQQPIKQIIQTGSNNNNNSKTTKQEIIASSSSSASSSSTNNITNATKQSIKNMDNNQNFAPKQESNSNTNINNNNNNNNNNQRPTTPQRNFSATNINNSLSTVKRQAANQPLPAKKQKKVDQTSSSSSSSIATSKMGNNMITQKNKLNNSNNQLISSSEINEHTFFEKIKKALRTQQVYENFLKCLALFNQDIVTRAELIQLVEPFLGKFANLFRWFKDYVENKPMNSIPLYSNNENEFNNNNNSNNINNTTNNTTNSSNSSKLMNGRDRINLPFGEHMPLEIDYLSCKQYGASYRDISSYPQPVSSGMTDLCKQVLNSTYVSFPSWSEDTTFISSKKNQYEELIFRVEDERFELDVVLETNSNTIRVLENIMAKISQMSTEELAKFRLDNKLGASSETIHIKAIQRIYGDKAKDFIEGLKRNPSVAVPLVLKRLKAKEEEWKEAKKNLEKQWREQIEKNYLKSLDHCAVPFKQNDQKHLKTKSLINEIESIYFERQEAKDESNQCQQQQQPPVVIKHTEPHLCYKYDDKSILEDAAALIIHHVKRQTTIQKEDKQKIKQIIYHFLPDLFFVPRGALSDDESADPLPPVSLPLPVQSSNQQKDEDNSSNNKKLRSTNNNNNNSNTNINNSNNNNNINNNNNNNNNNCQASSNSQLTLNNSNAARHTDTNKRRLTDVDHTTSLPHEYKTPEDMYRLFYVDEHWYLFFRYHQILCERLYKIYKHSMQLAEQEAIDSKNRDQSVAEALKLRNKSDISVDEYYPAFLDIVRNLLDGNMDSTQYEDTLREMFGINAYIAFTLDKVVHNCVRQLQYLAQDETSVNIKQLYCDEMQHHGCGGKVSNMSYTNVMNAEIAYQKKVESILTDENCYKIISYKNSCRLTIELIDTQSDEDDDEDEDAECEKWSEYVEKYSNNELDDDIKNSLLKKCVFLTRNAHYLKQKFGIYKENNNNSNNKDSKSKASNKNEETNSNSSSNENNKNNITQTNDNDEIKKEEPNSIINNSCDNNKNNNDKKRNVENFFMYRRNSLKLAKKVRYFKYF